MTEPTYAVVAGAAYDPFGPEPRAPIGSRVSLHPLDLDDTADIVLGRAKIVNIDKDGSFGPVHLWPGIWRVGLPDGTPRTSPSRRV